jgi:transcription-repair coupling factor (superfamily II helicase)
MPAGEIDEAMISFADGRADVLLATNIIESGLDLPRANTMVVWRPEKFGMAQLHQLRGRVGRGATRAFAYLMTDPDVPPKGASLKRLETLQELSGSGAGFEISDRDLDLRGGGDLLSEQQSGHVKVLGTALYRHLLTRAMAKDEDGGDGEWVPELRLEISGRLPKTYVQDDDTRLGIYARLFKCATEAELDSLEDELEQRFGNLPREAVSLLSMARIRADCKRLGLLRIDAGPEAVAATPQDRPNLKVRNPSGVRSDGNRVILDRPSGLEERLIAVEELIAILEEEN